MSGHSAWKNIKYKKEVADSKRSKAFSKMARQITIAAKEGGGDPEINSKLRLAIEKAKFINLPSENIEKAVKKGTGELGGVKLEPITCEAYGPGGIAMIIEGITDNKNRALSEIKQILSQNKGKLAGTGSVKWLFNRKGVIEVRSTKPEGRSKEEVELKAIEVGAEDTYRHNDILDIYTKMEDLEKVKKNLEARGVEIKSTSLDWTAQESIQVGEKDTEAAQKLFKALDESDNVQEIYSNLKT